MESVLMLIGFGAAAYSIVANDAIQTLGTFLSSNRERPWWVLWLFAVGILSAVLLYSWATNDGDVSYGRLSKIPVPETFHWYFVVPPFVLLALTRIGVPVSTTFLILTIFAPKNLTSMVTKSGLGYLLAFVLALGVYTLSAATVEKRFLATAKQPPARGWVVLQWASTGFLWSQWLIQDLANIFVYLPRRLGLGAMLAALGAMAAMHAYTFYTAGGEIQKIVTSKTNTTDIRAATIVDFLFGIILLVFKEYSKIPMSTTWVFLGLLAGREIALTRALGVRPLRETRDLVLRDGGKALAGLAVSVVLALALPRLAALAG
ncbi:MAG: hypothetical protein AAGN82_13390 [Myxococcota bacterium]